MGYRIWIPLGPGSNQVSISYILYPIGYPKPGDISYILYPISGWLILYPISYIQIDIEIVLNFLYPISDIQKAPLRQINAFTLRFC